MKLKRLFAAITGKRDKAEGVSLYIG